MDWNDLFNDIFTTLKEQEDKYQKYKGKTPYKLMVTKKGKFVITFKGKIEYRYEEIEEAKSAFIRLSKYYLGEPLD